MKLVRWTLFSIEFTFIARNFTRMKFHITFIVYKCKMQIIEHPNFFTETMVRLLKRTLFIVSNTWLLCPLLTIACGKMSVRILSLVRCVTDIEAQNNGPRMYECVYVWIYAERMRKIRLRKKGDLMTLCLDDLYHKFLVEICVYN